VVTPTTTSGSTCAVALYRTRAGQFVTSYASTRGEGALGAVAAENLRDGQRWPAKSGVQAGATPGDLDALPRQQRGRILYAVGDDRRYDAA